MQTNGPTREEHQERLVRVGQAAAVYMGLVRRRELWEQQMECPYDSGTPRVAVFSGRRTGAVFEGVDTQNMSTRDHPPHEEFTMTVSSMGHLDLSLTALVKSQDLQAQWLGILPHTTVLDCTSADLRKGLLTPATYAEDLIGMVAELVDNAEEQLQTPREVMAWRRHQEELHKFIVVAPGSEAVLQNLREKQVLLYSNNIMFCSPYSLVPPGGCPWEDLVVDRSIKEAIIRLHCERCGLDDGFTPQKVASFSQWLPGSPLFCCNRERQEATRNR